MTLKHRKYTKCTPRRFCDRLEEKLNPEANHGKGLTEFRITKLKTGKTQRLGVNYKMDEKDKGLLLTYCPWCGTNLLELFHLVETTGTMPEVAS